VGLRPSDQIMSGRSPNVMNSAGTHQRCGRGNTAAKSSYPSQA
jgi:hypothetical protein